MESMLSGLFWHIFKDTPFPYEAPVDTKKLHARLVWKSSCSHLSSHIISTLLPKTVSVMVPHACVIAVFAVVFADVIVERLKVRREAQEAKRRAEEAEQEAGSTKPAVDALTSRLDGGEDKDAEPKEDASPQGRSRLYIQCSLLRTPFVIGRLSRTTVTFPHVESDVSFSGCMLERCLRSA